MTGGYQDIFDGLSDTTAGVNEQISRWVSEHVQVLSKVRTFPISGGPKNKGPRKKKAKYVYRAVSNLDIERAGGELSFINTFGIYATSFHSKNDGRTTTTLSEHVSVGRKSSQTPGGASFLELYPELEAKRMNSPWISTTYSYPTALLYSGNRPARIFKIDLNKCYVYFDPLDPIEPRSLLGLGFSMMYADLDYLQMLWDSEVCVFMFIPPAAIKSSGGS